MNIIDVNNNEREYTVSEAEHLRELALVKKNRYLLTSVPGTFLIGIAPSNSNHKLADLMLSSSLMSVMQKMRGSIRFDMPMTYDKHFMEVMITLEPGELTLSKLKQSLPNDLGVVAVDGSTDIRLGELGECFYITLFLYRHYKFFDDEVVLDPSFVATTTIDATKSLEIIMMNSTFKEDNTIQFSAYSTLCEVLTSDSSAKLHMFTSIPFPKITNILKQMVCKELDIVSNSFH